MDTLANLSFTRKDNVEDSPSIGEWLHALAPGKSQPADTITIDSIIAQIIVVFPRGMSFVTAMKLQARIVQQPNASAQALLSLIDWIGMLNAIAHPEEQTILIHIFNHLNFPSSALPDLCLNRHQFIRELATQSPLCPDEGRVSACLLGMPLLESKGGIG